MLSADVLRQCCQAVASNISASVMHAESMFHGIKQSNQAQVGASQRCTFNIRSTAHTNAALPMRLPSYRFWCLRLCCLYLSLLLSRCSTKHGC